MSEHYLLIKHLHITAAYCSLAFFILRAAWSVAEDQRLKSTCVRVTPHLLDTLLLLLGVSMAVFLQLWPLPDWLSAKLVALLLYIFLGTLAIKRGPTPPIRAAAACLAVLVFIYMLGAAHQHHPLSWVIRLQL